MIRHKMVEIRAKAFEGKGVRNHKVSVVESLVDDPKHTGRKMLKVTVGVRDPETGGFTPDHDLCPAAIRRAIKLAMPWRVGIDGLGVIKRRFFTELDAVDYASRFGNDGFWYKEGGYQ
ncbi:MAG: hypothetical protein P8Y00_00025 [Deltaproteobacteria bacterium]